MSNGFKMTTVLPASPAVVYRAWLDARTHAAFTAGGAATSQPRAGGRFSAWDGYISGTYLVLEPGVRLVLAWRTTDFPPAAPDSRVELLLAPARGATRLTVVHAQIPPGQEADYQAGWAAFYFAPMRKYFAQSAHGPKPARRTGKARRAGVKRTAAKRRPRATGRRAVARKPSRKR